MGELFLITTQTMTAVLTSTMNKEEKTMNKE